MEAKDRHGSIQGHSDQIVLNGCALTMRPIGVFDSGVGGLSVLKALRAELPHERFVYLSDSGHAPYGERDDEHVIARAHAIARYLGRQHNIKALVVACNTATAAAIAELRSAHGELPIVGIEPALKPAVALSHTGIVGVMATRGTLNSEKFGRLLGSLNGQATFILQACDGLADAIEQANATKIIATCSMYTAAMGQFGTASGEIDTLVLGCTHYAFAVDQLASLVGPKVNFLEGGTPVARQTHRLLAERGQLATAPDAQSAHGAQLNFYTTGSPSILQTAVQRWLSLTVEVRSIAID